MSLKSPTTLRVAAPKKPEDIHVFVCELLAFKKSNIPLNEKQEQNSKLVLIELSTNAIKHVKDYENIIEVYLTETSIKIRKIDKGPRFFIDNKSFLKNNYTVEVVDNNTLLFKRKNVREEEELVVFPENFGFEIITNASENFTYEYNEETLENIFTVTISF